MIPIATTTHVLLEPSLGESCGLSLLKVATRVSYRCDGKPVTTVNEYQDTCITLGISS